MRRHVERSGGLAIAAMLFVLAFACAHSPSESAFPTSTPTTPIQATATAVPTATSISTPTPPPTITPDPTATPTATARPLPTAIPSPTPEPTPTEPMPTATPVYTGPTVIIGEVAFAVEVAVTPEQRRQGLSGRESLESGAGMLFVYESARPLQFWMVRMQFPLDFVWIGEDCMVGEISRDIPAPPPDADDSEIERVSPSGEMQYVLEINAGEAEELAVGDGVVFGGSIEGRYGC